jgi:hypothetical protein
MVDMNKINTWWKTTFSGQKEQVDSLLKDHFAIQGKAQIDPVSGIVNVSGNVEVKKQVKFTQLPVKFGEVTGGFVCGPNGLTSLQGAPTKLGGHFWCHMNQLTSLQGAPRHVRNSFFCQGNQLTSLAHAPTHVATHFMCTDNKLTSLKDAPVYVGLNFDCSHNQITSLQGAPDHVRGNFKCNNNRLTSLVHAPWIVDGDFDCSNNPITKPDHQGQVNGTFIITYHDQLHLLGLLKYPQLKILDAPEQVTAIMKKYEGKGKTYILNCARDLKQAKFVGNASV